MFTIEEIEPEGCLPHHKWIVVESHLGMTISVFTASDSSASPLGLRKRDAERLAAWLNRMVEEGIDFEEGELITQRSMN